MQKIQLGRKATTSKERKKKWSPSQYQVDPGQWEAQEKAILPDSRRKRADWIKE